MASSAKAGTAADASRPEVLLAYDEASKALFSADAFGTFGAIESSIFADESDFEKNYLDEARRYYANIVGKFGMQVQAVLKKAAGLEISMLLPLHGPVWRKDLGWFVKQNISSAYAHIDQLCRYAGFSGSIYVQICTFDMLPFGNSICA